MQLRKKQLSRNIPTMIKAIVKKPKTAEEIKEFRNINEVYREISINENVAFETFSGKLNIGMYYHDDGYYSGRSPNIKFHGFIVYGNIVFVGLDDEGIVKKLTNKQIAFVKNYLDHNSL